MVEESTSKLVKPIIVEGQHEEGEDIADISKKLFKREDSFPGLMEAPFPAVDEDLDPIFESNEKMRRIKVLIDRKISVINGNIFKTEMDIVQKKMQEIKK